MSILLTGGAGYIGSVTVERLRSRGEKVVVLDNLVHGHRQALHPDVPFYVGNVNDHALIQEIQKKHSIEACLHFAALAEVKESVENPAAYFENNVVQGLSLIHELLRLGVRKFVFSSSCATYGQPDQIPIRESSPQFPANPYGWSKLAIEKALESYAQAYGLNSVSLRYFNASGATESHGEDHRPESHLIPNILAGCRVPGAEVPVFGSDYPTPDGTAIRDYIHVSDLAEAHLSALEHLRAGGNSEFINLGTATGCSVLDVIRAAEQVIGQRIRARLEPRRAGDPAILVADNKRAHSVLGWRPANSSLLQIIRSQWEWRNAHPKGYAD